MMSLCDGWWHHCVTIGDVVLCAGKEIITREGQFVDGASSLPRSDLVKFMLSCLTSKTYDKKMIAVAIPKWCFFGEDKESKGCLTDLALIIEIPFNEEVRSFSSGDQRCHLLKRPNKAIETSKNWSSSTYYLQIKIWRKFSEKEKRGKRRENTQNCQQLHACWQTARSLFSGCLNKLIGVASLSQQQVFNARINSKNVLSPFWSQLNFVDIDSW